jgi:hypothetical protein
MNTKLSVLQKLIKKSFSPVSVQNIRSADFDLLRDRESSVAIILSIPQRFESNVMFTNEI